MRVLQISADRSKRGILHPRSTGYLRQKAYAGEIGVLDIIAFSRRSDRAARMTDDEMQIYPTNSYSRLLYGWNALQIARMLRKPDIVTAQDPFETGLVAWLVARYFGVPLHVQVHIDFLAVPFQWSLTGIVRVAIARFVLPRADHVRAVSRRLKEEIEMRYRLHARVSVLPVYVDIERYRTHMPDPALVRRFARFRMRALVVSRLVEPQKHIDLAIDSFAQAAPDDSCLIIVGSGSERSNLERMVTALNIQDRVFFEGERESAPYYAIADILLVPSRFEGYGMVIVEALASGVPVLSTDVGIAREAGAIVTDEAGYATALRNWFAHGERLGRLLNYPFETPEAYRKAYVADLAASLV